MTGGTVSVIIPTFNRAHQVRGAIESVLGQVGAGEVEVIVADDGSTDGTRESIQDAFGGDPRVRYLHQTNAGAAAARNAALALAAGEYIAFLDSDDAWKPWHLRLQLAGLARYPEAGLIWANLDLVDAHDGLIAARALTTFLTAYRYFSFSDLFQMSTPISELGVDIPVGSAGERLYVGDVFSQMLMGNLLFISTVVMRRERVQAVGGFNTSLAASEDYEFLFRACREGPVAFADAPSIRYRIGTADRLSRPAMLILIARTYLHILEATVARDADRITLPSAMIEEARWRAHGWIATEAILAGRTSEARLHVRAATRIRGPRPGLWVLLALTFLPTPFVHLLITPRARLRRLIGR
jgi:glycosyltransferase involved in cell wall biosynthesis